MFCYFAAEIVNWLVHHLSSSALMAQTAPHSTNDSDVGKDIVWQIL